MTRDAAIRQATDHYDSGAFLEVLRRRVKRRTVSQEDGQLPELLAYLTEEIIPEIERLGFTAEVVPNTRPEFGPFLIAKRREGDGVPTVLIYGHGDTVRGQEGQWRDGLTPWDVTVEGDRWYGRGIADNKGQHTINISALEQVLLAREGRLGFNTKLLIEMGEETGSPGLKALCEQNREGLGADLLIASDGPRLSAERPTVFLGSRGLYNFELEVSLREGAHHSGNWGGLLRNAGTVLANAIASLVDARGRILVERLRPPPIAPAVANALRDLKVAVVRTIHRSMPSGASRGFRTRSVCSPGTRSRSSPSRRATRTRLREQSPGMQRLRFNSDLWLGPTGGTSYVSFGNISIVTASRWSPCSRHATRS